jgi:RNA polymerase primary sigma factor
MENLEENDPLRLYLEELARTPAAGDPQVLAEAAAAGDESAAGRLAAVCMPLALEAAYAMTGRGVLLLDLIQEASLGLWEGILNFPGGDFESHIRWWTRQYAARAVVAQARQNGVGQKLRTGMEKLRRADRDLLGRLGRNPTLEELAQEIGVTPEEAETYRDTLMTASALAKAKAPQEPEPQEEEQAVENTALFQSRQRIADMLSGLSEREAKLLTLRFGLEGGKPLTAAQSGEKLGITADEAVDLEAAALAKLRK